MVRSTNIDRVVQVDFQDVVSDTGRLTAVEGGKHIPFQIARVFYVHQVKREAERGGHAHRETEQVLVGLRGSCRLEISDGNVTKSYLLEDPARGVYIPRMLWIRLRDFSSDAICLVFCNTLYGQSESIGAWEDYLKALS